MRQALAKSLRWGIVWALVTLVVAATATTVTAGATAGSDNGEGVPLDIGNYVLRQYDSTRSYTIPLGTVVSPQSYVIVARNCDKAGFEDYWNVTLEPEVVFLSSGNIIPSINGDETYELLDSNGTTIDGRTGQPAPSGRAIQRISVTDDATLPSSWRVEPESSATPGSGVYGAGTGGLVINEYCDASGAGNFIYEFIELYYDATARNSDPPQPVPPVPEVPPSVLVGGGLLALGSWFYARRHKRLGYGTLIGHNPAARTTRLVRCAIQFTLCRLW